ncbi:MAG: nitroreductase family protein [Candidatus Methanoperedens sp.]|nr:nitroreductase family protein [Candidatus Methanoperedens sp.]
MNCTNDIKESNIVFDVIKKRRSVRRFDRRPIPKEIMEHILEGARWAPSGANVQPWRFIVVEKREMLEALGNICYYRIFKSRHVNEAGAAVVICADIEAGSATYMLDCAIAGTNMTLMATSLGIGSCWIGAFEEPTVRGMLKIPQKLKIIALIAFGFEVGKASAPPRLPLSKIVHHDTYAGEPDLLSRIVKSGPFSVFGKLLRVLFNKR